MKRLSNLALTLSLSFFLGLGLSACQEKECIENVNPDCAWIMVYDPVCGCNGKTYSNSGEAECKGILEYTPGACGK